LAFFVALFLYPKNLNRGDIIVPNPNLRTGHASWYGPGFFGRQMANGDIYEPNEIFVACRSYPFGTPLRITNLQNHRSIVAKVEDRGPYVPGRSLDLSERAGEKLGMIRPGVVPVSFQIALPMR